VSHQEIDLANPKGNLRTAGFTKEEREQFSKFIESGWKDTFRHLNKDTVKYSYWSMRTNARASNQGWRLDFFVINDEAMAAINKSLINNDILGSDHCPIELEISMKKL